MSGYPTSELIEGQQVDCNDSERDSRSKRSQINQTDHIHDEPVQATSWYTVNQHSPS